MSTKHPGLGLEMTNPVKERIRKLYRDSNEHRVSIKDFVQIAVMTLRAFDVPTSGSTAHQSQGCDAATATSHPQQDDESYKAEQLSCFGLWTGARRDKVLKQADYESPVPRCCTCVHFRKATHALFNSMPVYVTSRCIHLHTRVDSMGLCSHWAGRDGGVLESSCAKEGGAA